MHKRRLACARNAIHPQQLIFLNCAIWDCDNLGSDMRIM